MKVGELIRNRRIELGISQEELAKRAGYSCRTAISKIEMGERDVPRAKIIALAGALHVSPSYLMGWEDIDGNEIIEPQESLSDKLYKAVGTDKLTDDEIEQIINYSKFIISQRKKES